MDFAAVAKEKLAIFIARRKKVNFTAGANKNLAIIIARNLITTLGIFSRSLENKMFNLARSKALVRSNMIANGLEPTLSYVCRAY